MIRIMQESVQAAEAVAAASDSDDDSDSTLGSSGTQLGMDAAFNNNTTICHALLVAQSDCSN